MLFHKIVSKNAITMSSISFLSVFHNHGMNEISGKTPFFVISEIGNNRYEKRLSF